MKKLLWSCAAILLAIPAFAGTDALSLVPNDAVTVGVVRLADMRSSPLSSMLFEQTDKVSANGDAADFLRQAGLQPSRDIDVLMVATTLRSNLGHNGDVIIAADGRFEPGRLIQALVDRGAVRKTTPNGSYYLIPKDADEDHNGAAAFPDSHLVLVGSEPAVIAAMNARAAGGTSFFSASGLGRESVKIDPRATAWALVDVTRAQRLTDHPHVSERTPSGQAINSALRAVSTLALWATDTGNALKLGAFGLSNDQETLGLLEDTVRGALAAMRLAAQDKQPELVGVLRQFNVSRNDNSVMVTGSVPARTFRAFASHARTR
ncbi:MAG TPA: hypothetical protein VKH35_08500 [Thermoanaerobaculia bacterium]|nr:hypothetical protein [Thermoanaerobaculia bacterium]